MNIILITLDGFRADRVALGPNMKRIFGNNLYFSNMVTAAPYTIGSLHAVYSGIYPSMNGVNSYFNMFRYKSSCKSITQYLKDAGYFCIADAFNLNVIPKAGFDKFFVHEEKYDLLERHKKIISEETKHDKFFLFLHNTTVHKQVIDTVAKKFDDFNDEYFDNKEKYSAAYDSYVPQYDSYVKGIIDHLDSIGLSSNTIVIFHSDHGCSVGDRKGERMYGVFTYDYSIKTFCTFVFPNAKYTNQVKYNCATIDILPTILDILGIKQDPLYDAIQGKSLMTFVNGSEIADRLTFTETGGLYGPWPSHREHNVFCVRYNGKKIIYNKTPKTWEFYDLTADPEEKNNIYNESNSTVIEYKKLLLQKLEENKLQL